MMKALHAEQAVQQAQVHHAAVLQEQVEALQLKAHQAAAEPLHQEHHGGLELQEKAAQAQVVVVAMAAVIHHAVQPPAPAVKAELENPPPVPLHQGPVVKAIAAGKVAAQEEVAVAKTRAMITAVTIMMI